MMKAMGDYSTQNRATGRTTLMFNSAILSLREKENCIFLFETMKMASFQMDAFANYVISNFSGSFFVKNKSDILISKTQRFVEIKPNKRFYFLSSCEDIKRYFPKIILKDHSLIESEIRKKLSEYHVVMEEV